MSATAGSTAKRSGDDAERQVDEMHAIYARMPALPLVVKQPAGFRATGRAKDGAVVGHWLHTAPVDYLGTLPDGRAVALEVKSCAALRWRLESRGECVIRDAQWRALDAYASRGAVVAVLVRLAGQWWWCPWSRLGPAILRAIDAGMKSLGGAEMSLWAGARCLGRLPDWAMEVVP